MKSHLYKLSAHAHLTSSPTTAALLQFHDKVICIECFVYNYFTSRRRRSGIAGAGLNLYTRLILHFNVTNIVIQSYLNTSIRLPVPCNCARKSQIIFWSCQYISNLRLKVFVLLAQNNPIWQTIPSIHYSISKIKLAQVLFKTSFENYQIITCMYSVCSPCILF